MILKRFTLWQAYFMTSSFGKWIIRTDKANPAQSQLSGAGTTFMFTLFIRVVAGANILAIVTAACEKRAAVGSPYASVSSIDVNWTNFNC